MTPAEMINAVLTESQNMPRPAYRGQEEADWDPLSGAVRRLRDAYGDVILSDENELRTLVAQYHREHLIMPMQLIDGEQMSDMQRLSLLQHQGAATGLLDFTESVLIALWFACAGSPDKDGKVFMLDIGDHQVAANGRSMQDPFDANQPVVYYEPDRSLGPRIVAQQSIFVICNPRIPDPSLSSVIVPRETKGPLREHLTRLGLLETRLFGDVPGLAAANSTRVPLQKVVSLTPEQHRNRGNRAYQVARYVDALTAYDSFAAAQPNVAQPHCLRGDALAALGRFEEAIEAYTKAIENIRRPIDVARGVVLYWEAVGRRMLQALYFNRANAYATTGNHRAAVEDFNSSLQDGNEQMRNVLYNRGNSKFALGMFMEAHDDFEAAWSERPGSDAALAMGNCKVMVGEFDEAMRRYMDGSAEQPESIAARCRESAEHVHRILETLNGRDYRVRREASLVTIEADWGPAEGIFPFSGNRGNSGNVPSGMTAASGGQGYGGMMGFAVSIACRTA